MKHPVKNKSRWGHETDPPRPQGKPKNIEKPDIQACCIEKIRNNSSLNNGIVENQSRCSISYYGTGALNFSEFETTDSIIIDLLAPEIGVGTFYAEVFAATGSDTGFYELFGYTLSAIPEPTSFAMFGIAVCVLAPRRRRER